METTISTVVADQGTTEGLKSEIRECLTPNELRACRKAANQGWEVVCRGLHPFGFYSSTSVFLRHASHYDVKNPVDAMIDELYTFQTKSWRTDISSGKVKTIPFRGDDQVDMERRILQVMKWNGSLYDLAGNLTDLSGMGPVATRNFLRLNTFPRWQIDARQKQFPVYVDEDIDFATHEMLVNANTLLEQQQTDFLVYDRWLKEHGESGNPYVIGLGTLQGLRVTEADE